MENPFDIFWRIYPKVGRPPKRRDKKDAIKAWNKALKEAPAEVIISAAKRFAAEKMGEDPKYIRHAPRWLNAASWLDDEEISLPSEKSTGFYAEFGSRELEAWDAYGRATTGKDYPRTKRGGWYFPSRWPPGFDRETSQECKILRERGEGTGRR